MEDFGELIYDVLKWLLLKITPNRVLVFYNHITLPLRKIVKYTVCFLIFVFTFFIMGLLAFGVAWFFDAVWGIQFY